MASTESTTFEQKFGAHVPLDTKISMKDEFQQATELKPHQSVGIIIKVLAYLIDIGLTILIVPILINVFHYLKRGQSLGQWAIGARVYNYQTIGQIASIRQLMTRFIVKFVFLFSRAIIGINLIMMLFDGIGYDTQYNVTYGVMYTVLMITWIHGYALTMFSSTKSRGIHDIISGTVVAYDTPYSAKKVILSLIGCAILYYIILWMGPSIIQRVSNYVSSRLGNGYWTVWTWIDTWIITGLREANF